MLSEPIKPCPFCGEQGNLDVREGSTFRWMLAACSYCGAQAPEVRIDTLNKDRDEAIAQGRVDAITAWNARAPDTDPNAQWLTEAHMLCTDHGIPQGHITGRIQALREKLSKGEHSCYCDDSIIPQMVSGGAAPEGLYGRVTLLVDGKYVDYVQRTQAAQPVEPVAELRCVIADLTRECKELRDAVRVGVDALDDDRYVSKYTHIVEVIAKMKGVL